MPDRGQTDEALSFGAFDLKGVRYQYSGWYYAKSLKAGHP